MCAEQYTHAHTPTPPLSHANTHTYHTTHHANLDDSLAHSGEDTFPISKSLSEISPYSGVIYLLLILLLFVNPSITYWNMKHYTRELFETVLSLHNTFSPLFLQW